MARVLRSTSRKGRVFLVFWPLQKIPAVLGLFAERSVLMQLPFARTSFLGWGLGDAVYSPSIPCIPERKTPLSLPILDFEVVGRWGRNAFEELIRLPASPESVDETSGVVVLSYAD